MFDKNSAPVLSRVVLADGSFRAHRGVHEGKVIVKTKTGNPVYKFSKKTGKNCGPVYVGEKRNRNRYDYNDE